MRLDDLLSKRKTSILEKWFDAVLDSYPSDTSKFLRNQKNRFTNPVGATISQGIEKIFDELLSGQSSDDFSEFLDNIVKIRAVQDFTPSEALGFIFKLKKIVRDELADDITPLISEELFDFETRTDNLMMSAFDNYMKCREKIYDFKANQAKNMTFRLLQRAKLICDVTEEEMELEVSDNLNIKRKEVKK